MSSSNTITSSIEWWLSGYRVRLLAIKSQVRILLHLLKFGQLVRITSSKTQSMARSEIHKPRSGERVNKSPRIRSSQTMKALSL